MSIRLKVTGVHKDTIGDVVVGTIVCQPVDANGALITNQGVPSTNTGPATGGGVPTFVIPAPVTTDVDAFTVGQIVTLPTV